MYITEVLLTNRYWEGYSIISGTVVNEWKLYRKKKTEDALYIIFSVLLPPISEKTLILVMKSEPHTRCN